MKNLDFLQNEIFDQLIIREKEILRSNSAILDFDAEGMLFKSGSFSSFVYYIEEGCLKLKKDDRDLFFILEKGNILGLDYIFNDEPVYYSAYASKGSRIVQINAHILRNFVSSNSLFLGSVYRKNSTLNKKLISSLLDYRAKNLNGAFAAFLLQYDQENSPELTRKEIGSLLGYSRENITKVVRSFIAEGIIEEDEKHIRIMDKNLLETLRKNG
ncbi:MAG: Crp/Fnr family transcriptional regulator [Chryseobacterium sp.]|nr:Crp/Fnr family transcriptional regulator [Chryseobacterium sp.]